MDDVLRLVDLLEIGRLIRRRAVSSAELSARLLDLARSADHSLNAFATLCPDMAMAMAAAADAEISKGLHRGPLHGVPISVKDLVDIQDYPTASGTRIFADNRACRDATVVARLKQAGAVIIGKTQMTEGATIAHHPDVSPPVNPWATNRCSGFSSSGSGVAVAAGLSYAAIGSDTGGSIRLPSAMNGVTGLKPSWGLVSRHGAFPAVEAFDTIGPIARTAADAAAILSVIAGFDPRDPTCSRLPVPDYLGAIGQGIAGVSVGVDMAEIERSCAPRVVAAIHNAFAHLTDLGVDFRTIGWPEINALAMFPLFLASMADVHRAHYPSRREEYGPALAAFLDRARASTGADVAAAVNQTHVMKGHFQGLFSQVDLLLVPVISVATPMAGAVEQDLLRDPASILELSRYNLPFSVSGHPTITLQAGEDENGMPVAFQLVAKHFDEALLFRAGHAFQSITDWHVRHPPPRH